MYVFGRAVDEDVEVFISVMFSSEFLLQRLDLFGGVGVEGLHQLAGGRVDGHVAHGGSRFRGVWRS